MGALFRLLFVPSVLSFGVVLIMCVVGAPFRPLQQLNVWTMRLIGAALIAVSAGIGLLCLFALHDPHLETYSKLIGVLSLFVAFAAANLWIDHQIYRLFRHTGWGVVALARRSFQYLYRHHSFIGWVVLATGTAHGLYYLLVPSGAVRVQTGVLDWLLLAALATLGWAVDTVLRRRAIKAHVRLWHTVLALLFVVVLVLHV